MVRAQTAGRSMRSTAVAADGFVIQRILEKDLNAANAELLWDRLSALAFSGKTRLVVDLSGVVLIDSSAMWVLLSAHKLLQGDGGKLVLFGLRPQVAYAFRLARMDQVLTIVSAEHQAVRLMLADPPPLELARIAG
jgi:anti-anti-sigma factor